MNTLSFLADLSLLIAALTTVVVVAAGALIAWERLTGRTPSLFGKITEGDAER